MTSYASQSSRSSARPVIVVPGREVSGSPRTWPGPTPHTVDAGLPEPGRRVTEPGWSITEPGWRATEPAWPVTETDWPVTEAAEEGRRGSALVTFGVIMGLVALTVGLVALAAPGAVRAATGWASSMLDGDPPAQTVSGSTPAPSPTGLDPELAGRVEAARAAAAADGVELSITSGWRTQQEQQVLVDQALERYGTEAEAHRWVAPVTTSAHVLGKAVDVGPTEGALWLQEHGAQFGLCQVFANEVWHFEATIEPGGTCPALVPDASGLWN